MDQLRQVGEVVGSLKALMVLKHEISINQRQCCLLFETMELAFDTISEEIRQNLRLDEKNTKWKALELPLKELHRVMKDAECYIRYCMDIKNWWGKAISLHTNRDCVELHLHNLLSCFTVVIEAIETAAEISGADEDDVQKKRSALLHKYDHECDDPKFFLWKFGKQFLVSREACTRMETAWREDRWLLFEKVGEKKAAAVSKTEQKLAELLLRKLNDVETSKKVMSSIMLVGAQDYQVRRRLGSGYPTGPGHLKEIHWLGESFALRTFIGDVAPLLPEISCLLSYSHPNILQYHCAFYDEGRKEGFLVMELMAKDLGSYIKEHSGQRNRVPFTIPVAVDIMLQIARGMEYLHSTNIHHGDLNPSNILLKPRNSTTGGFQAKVTGFGIPAIKSCATRSSPKPAPAPAAVDADIWLAPEVLAELEQPGGKCNAKYTEKADVYSFGMLCFELLTGKVPFEDGHLQGDQISRNIRAGERPLFSFPSPKCLANLTKKCWQTNPSLRPSFSSICRILRYIKKILVINPDHGLPDSPPPLVDYCDLEAAYLKKFPGEGSGVLAPVTQIPFQMVAYKVVEKEKTITKKWDMATEGMVRPPASIFDEEQLAAMDDLFLVPTDRRSVCSDIIDSKNSAVDVDLRTVISETMQRKLYQLDSFVPEIPRKKYPKPPAAPEIENTSSNLDEENSKSEQKSPSSASSDGKRLPEIPEKKRTFVKKLQNIKTKMIPETPKHEAPMSSPARAKKAAGAGMTAAASPTRALSKTTMLSSSPTASASPTRSFNQKRAPVRGGMKSSNSPASSPAREFRPKNEPTSTMQSPGRMKKAVLPSYSPASSPSRGVYNVCPSPIHPSTYNAYPSLSPMSSPMNPNIRPSRLGPSDSSPQINYPI
ncbi:Protein kinase family protein [Perilla frutescens var. hirtella]|nr:Protein kinase family protein [Perilla frutescens var. frutescens]KAH6783380.1 Protein kinase family protein [Perilla frutescens var. hirtella]